MSTENTIKIEDNNSNVIIFPSSDLNGKQAQISYTLLKSLVANLSSASIGVMIENMRQRLQDIRYPKNDSTLTDTQKREAYYAAIMAEIDLKNLIDAIATEEAVDVVPEPATGE